MAQKLSILERLRAGEMLLSDGGYVIALERRGYVRAGTYTPEVAIEHPEAVRGIHREFARAGSDILQALTFYCSDDKLELRGNTAGQKYGSEAITRAACRLAREVANEFGGLFVSASISQTPSYVQGKGKQVVQDLVRKQVQVHKEEGVDLIIVEYFLYSEEIAWCIEAAKEFGLPVVSTMCIGPDGDLHEVSPGDCAVRMTRAGADAVGVNCHYDPYISIRTMRSMKSALQEAGLQPFLMCQPLGYMTADSTDRLGYYSLPEFPLAMETRLCNRFDFSKFARAAYELGISIIGGCCGADATHIRAMAEELATERGRQPAAHDKTPDLSLSGRPEVQARNNKEYWLNLQPVSGRQPRQ